MNAVAADSDLVRTYRPRMLLVWVIVFAVILVGGSITVWVMLGADIQELFTGPQIWTLLGLLGLGVAIMFAGALSSVEANPIGLVVRNGPAVQRWTWQQVDGIRFRDGDAWAFALFRTDDGEIISRPMLGIQRTDGARAEQAVAEIRERLTASRG